MTVVARALLALSNGFSWLAEYTWHLYIRAQLRKEVAVATEQCNESITDYRTDDMHTCRLPKGHDGAHRCSEKLCGKVWRQS